MSIADVDDGSLKPVNKSREPRFAHFGRTDLQRAESAVRELRALDYRFGGGHNRAVLSALLDWGDHMLAGTVAEPARDGTYTVVADMHNLAGWTAFDIGDINSALHQFDRALELARLAEDTDLVANVFYRIGRVHLHHHAPDRALTAFSGGLAAMENTWSPPAAGILLSNQAWAHASTGALGPALTCLGQARDEFAKTNPIDAPTWARFFNTTDLAAMTGVTYTELARRVDRRYTAFAIPALEEACAAYRSDMARSKALTTTALALSRLLEGDLSMAITDANTTLELAAMVDSTRIADRMAPLRAEVHQRCTRGSGDDLHDLARRMAIFTHRGRVQPVSPAVAHSGT